MNEVCDRCRHTLVAGDNPPLCRSCRREQHEAYVRQGLVPGNYVAQNVPIVDQPEAYAKMREAAGLCPDCHGDRGAHYSNCPRIAAAFAQQRVQPTGDMLRADANARLDAALRRIEQLEADVARLKGPRHVQPQYDRYRCARCEFEYPTAKDLAEHQYHRASPATAYPPMPDEGAARVVCRPPDGSLLPDEGT